MAAGHAVRGVVTAWLSLIVLQTVSTKGGSGRLAALFEDTNRVLQRAFDPNIPAIPDRRGGASGSSSGSSGSAPVNVGADPSVTSPSAPYSRPAGIPTSPIAPSSPSRVGGIGGQPYAN